MINQVLKAFNPASQYHQYVCMTKTIVGGLGSRAVSSHVGNLPTASLSVPKGGISTFAPQDIC
jgi:hypothetical protein